MCKDENEERMGNLAFEISKNKESECKQSKIGKRTYCILVLLKICLPFLLLPLLCFLFWETSIDWESEVTLWKVGILFQNKSVSFSLGYIQGNLKEGIVNWILWVFTVIVFQTPKLVPFTEIFSIYSWAWKKFNVQ